MSLSIAEFISLKMNEAEPDLLIMRETQVNFSVASHKSAEEELVFGAESIFRPSRGPSQRDLGAVDPFYCEERLFYLAR